ncbi:MAG: hypothetical protein ACRERU_08670, partial [Methylococcales bacterium]
DLPDASVDLCFTFLSQWTDLCFEAYPEQIVRLAQDTPTISTHQHEPPDLDDAIPFSIHPPSSRVDRGSPCPSFTAGSTMPSHLT